MLESHLIVRGRHVRGFHPRESTRRRVPERRRRGPTSEAIDAIELRDRRGSPTRSARRMPCDLLPALRLRLRSETNKSCSSPTHRLHHPGREITALLRGDDSKSRMAVSLNHCHFTHPIIVTISTGESSGFPRSLTQQRKRAWLQEPGPCRPAFSCPDLLLTVRRNIATEPFVCRQLARPAVGEWRSRRRPSGEQEGE